MSLAATANALLRTHSADRVVAAQRPRDLLALLLVAGFTYGAVMGSSDLRPLQALYSGLKVPLLLTVSSAVCLPSFFVLNTLLGLRADFATVVRALAGSQLTMALVLASLWPFTALVYMSSDDYQLAVVFNGTMFLLASLAGYVALGRVYRTLIIRRPRHRLAKRFWMLLYVFVTIQLAWMLRPFIGSPGLPTTFLRQGVWDNAYVIVLNDVWRFLLPYW